METAIRPGQQRVASSGGQITRLIESGLTMHFQPIVDIQTGEVYAHEALMRTLPTMATITPLEVLRLARSESALIELEWACMDRALRIWSIGNYHGRLFLNCSGEALQEVFSGLTHAEIGRIVEPYRINPKSIVIEITEHERIGNLGGFLETAQALRNVGFEFALDDFGDGHSNVRLWAELMPEFVKIDKYFSMGIASDAIKIRTVQMLQQMAHGFGSTVIVEGIEDLENLLTLRDMGIGLGQGYFLARPDARPLRRLREEVLEGITRSAVKVLPNEPVTSVRLPSMDGIVIHAPAISPDTTNYEVSGIFGTNPHLHALAVVDGNRPMGLINRSAFLLAASKRYFYEVFGRKPAEMFVKADPLLLEINSSIKELLNVLTAEDQSYLSDGFIFTENGNYRGLGRGEQLVKIVTESRIEAARHANPLTYLPGNIPISEHINRLLERGAHFTVCYADLAHFKPLNDKYGYWVGDECIRLVAKSLLESLVPGVDFLGHVGGDDFIVIYQSEDWMTRLKDAIGHFNRQVPGLYESADVQAGGIYAEDRQGVTRFFELTTLYAGAVAVAAGTRSDATAVSSMAAKARNGAKLQGLSVYPVSLADGVLA
jgi:EAL domain-containing protein (putative c-di-GMP-specific phosphodiesterase class I)/GGDEF domain-containing protein